MAHKSKLGGGRYKVRWRDPAPKGQKQRERSRIAPNRKTAEQLLRQVEEAIARGEAWEAEGVRAEQSLRQLARDWLQELTVSKALSTRKNYAEKLDGFLDFLVQEGWPEPQAAVLHRKLLHRFHEHLGTCGGRKGDGRSISTRNKHIQIVQAFWKWAYATTPDLVAPPQVIDLPHAPSQCTEAPSWAEMDACIAAARRWIRQVAIVMRFTGLRVQQVMALKKADINSERATLRVRGELGKSRSEKTGRLVPVSRHLLDEISTWTHSGPWLVPCPRKQRLARSRDMARAWRRAGVRGAIWEDRPNHCFRRGFISELRRAGADADAVEHLVGHKLSGEKAAYIDPSFLPLKEAVEKIPPLGGQPDSDDTRDHSQRTATLDTGAGGHESPVRLRAQGKSKNSSDPNGLGGGWRKRMGICPRLLISSTYSLSVRNH